MEKKLPTIIIGKHAQLRVIDAFVRNKYTSIFE